MWKVYIRNTSAPKSFDYIPVDAPTSHEVVATELTLREAQQLVELLNKGNQHL